MKRLLLLLLTLTPPAFAQTVDLNLTAVSNGPGVAAPTLTWANPTANSCTASGDAAWTGTKPPSGTTGAAGAPGALLPVTVPKLYTLVCTWGGSSTAIVSWGAPTTNSDGTPLTDLAGFKVYWNNGGGPEFVTAPGGKVRTITSPSVLTTTITGLAAGTWYFTASAVKTNGVEGGIANIASLALGAGGTATKTVVLLFPGTAGVLTVR